MKRVKRDRIKKLMIMLVLLVVLVVPIGANAATTATYDNGKREDLIKGEMIGRYCFNYTGNTNYNQYWLADSSGKYIKKTYSSDTTNNVSKTRKTAAAKALGLTKNGAGNPDKITNSTTSKLTKTSGASSIVKAYLIWQTRSSSTDGIALVAPDNTAKEITAAASYVDERKTSSWTRKSLYCHYADVTDTVAAKGYGNYSVCNIPVWSATGTEGGESMASWELIVIEEGNSFPMRSLMLRMTAIFNQDTNLDAKDIPQTLINASGLKTPSDTGNNVISGQVFYMASVSSTTSGTLSASIYFGDSKPGNSSKIKKIDKSSQGGMMKEDTLVGTSSTCIRGDLEDFKAKITTGGTTTRFGFSQTKATLELSSQKWMSFFLFGLAVDVAQPEMTSSQTTTVNSSSSVTVTGRADNNSAQAKTGFYDGTLTVTLDSALTATSATVVCYDKNGDQSNTKTISGNISGNTVIFDSVSLNKISGHRNGSYLTYSIECSVDTSQGKTQFNNSHELTGKLYSREYETGVEVFLTDAASSAIPMYAVTLIPADNIDTVSATDLAASKAAVTKDYTYGSAVSITATPDSDSEFTKWVKEDGTEITNNPYSFTIPNKNTTYTAYGKKVYYKVTLHAGTGIDSVSGEGVYLKGATVNIGAAVKEGYHWQNWTGTYNTDSINYSFTMPDQDVEMTANGEANPYTIHFDPNGGMGHIDDIVTTYDTDVTLPDGAAAYKKYTLDGVNVTADVESGAISEKMIFSGRTEEDTEQEELFSEEAEPSVEASELPEKDAEGLQVLESTEATETAENGQNKEFDAVTADDETETGEEPETEDESTSDEETKQAEGAADKTVYPSVFLGWALYDDKDNLMPAWRAGDVVRNLTVENGGEITLYAVWDDCPWIEAHDLYYSLEQAQSGYITEEEILSHATATDREDGSPILPGINPAANKPEVNTSFTIPDYQASEFTNMTHDAAISENLTVTDSSGSTYRKQIMVYVVDTTPQKVKPEGTTRFISEKYFNTDYEHGGLEDNSIWKTDPEYTAVLQSAFDNLKNDTPEQTYYFTHETILEMQQFIQDHGVGNSEEPGALQLFYDTFMAPNRTS